MTRTYDPEIVKNALALYPYNPIDLDVDMWLRDRNNLAFKTEDGSVAMFEWVRPGLFDGHYFFHVRGREAINLSRQIIQEVYENYGVKAIRGFTPVQHKAAIWMSKHLGFKPMAIVPTDIGDCVLFLMNLDEHFKGTDE